MKITGVPLNDLLGILNNNNIYIMYGLTIDTHYISFLLIIITFNNALDRKNCNS